MCDKYTAGIIYSIRWYSTLQNQFPSVCVFLCECYLTTLTVLYLSAGAVEPSNPCAILRLTILFFLAIPGALGSQKQRK